MDKVDLWLVSLEDLVDEVCKRGSVAIVVVVDVERKMNYWNWVGDYYTALGLCSDLSHTIMKSRDDD